jgi:hypothetical protein
MLAFLCGLMFFSGRGVLLMNARGFFCPASNPPYSSGTIVQLIGNGQSVGSAPCTLAGTGQLNPTIITSISPQALQTVLSFINGCISGATRVTHCSTGSGTADYFNKDGNLDVALSSQVGGVVNILIGGAAGSVQQIHSYAVGQNPVTVLSGDFNGDGNDDLAVVNFGPLAGGTGSVSILLGIGDGSFQPAVYYAVGTSPISAVVGDFNGDGKLDLVVVNSGPSMGGSLSILLGNGDGTFQNPTTITLGSSPQSIAIGDFNGDGKLDLAVGVLKSSGGGMVSVFLGKGDGTFQNPVNYNGGDSPFHMAVGDLNGDGKLDLVIANYYSNNISILFGNGDGTFRNAVFYAVGHEPNFVGIGDVDGDGKVDLVVLNHQDQDFSILFGNGDGTFRGTPLFLTSTQPTFIGGADLRGSGKPDVIIANQFQDTLSILLNNGNGTFQPPTQVNVERPDHTQEGTIAFAAGDFNGDGKADIAVADYFSGRVSILLGNGDTTFQTPVVYPTAKDPSFVAVGDFNADGKLDLAVANLGDAPGTGTTLGSVSILMGNGDGSFQPAVNLTAGSHPRVVAVGDFNGDGKLDLAVVNYGDPSIVGDAGDVEILLGNGNGTFQTPIKYVVGMNPNYLALGDFNGDGHMDMVVSTRGPSFSYNIAVLMGTGTGTFQAPVLYPVDYGPQALAVGDINGDGKADIVVAHCCGAVDTTYLLNNGDGTFATEVHLTAGPSPASLYLADFSGNGKLDLALADYSGPLTGSAAVLLNQSVSSCPNISMTPGSTPNGTINVPYNQTLIASGGAVPYSFALTGGVLPPGVLLSASGILSGTPTSGGVFQFTATATDANFCRRSQSYSLTVTGSASAGNPTRNLSLSSGGAVAASTIGSSGPVQAGDATVTVNSGNPPYGTAVFSLTQGGIVESEAGVPASPPTTHGRIFIDFRTGVSAKENHVATGTISIDTGFAIVNRTGSTANLTFTLRDSNGNPLATGSGPLPAGAHRAKFIDQLSDIASNFNLPPTFSTTTQFATLDISSSDQPISILALRLTNNQRGDTLLTSTPIADLNLSPPTGTLYFAQIVDGGGYNTTLVLINTSSSPENGSIQLYKDDGTALTVTVSGSTASSFRYSIAAGGFFIFQTDGSPSIVNAGSVQVIPDSSNSTPVGAGVFRFTQGGIVVTESGIPSATPTTHARIYVDESNHHDTGVAIANAGSSSLALAVQAYQLDGATPVGSSNGIVNMSTNGHTAKFVGELISGLPPGFTGLLDISSITPFGALTLRSLTNSRGDFLLTTFPIADFNQAAPAPIVFPQIADGGGYRTQFIFISPSGAATVTLSFFGDDGTASNIGKTSRVEN